MNNITATTVAKDGRKFIQGEVGRVILRWPAVKSRYGKSRTQIWRDVRDGKFPAPVQMGPNSIGWWSDELDVHDAALKRVNYAPPHNS